IEAPFHCAYGFNLFLGDGVFLNAGCTILDTAPVRIGKATLLGPNVQIYCAEHHKEAAGRQAGLEIAKPVEISDNA
ncbi:MAG: sugar O-acetyltransferase, partial [Mesorhizobium sp.]